MKYPKVNDKVVPELGNEGVWRSGGIVPRFVFGEPDEDEWSAIKLRQFSSRENNLFPCLESNTDSNIFIGLHNTFYLGLYYSLIIILLEKGLNSRHDQLSEKRPIPSLHYTILLGYTKR